MTRIWPVVIVWGLLLALATPAVAAIPSPVAGALPAKSRVVAVVTLPGHPKSRAVAFDSGGHYIAVVVLGHPARLIWRDKLPGGIRSLQTPGPTGAFDGLTGSGPSRQFFAFRLSGGSVSSALWQLRGGLAPADEGMQIDGSSLTLVYRDRTHMGSVRYRLTARYTWSGGSYRPEATVRAPDYPQSKYPLPSGTVQTSSGDVLLIRLEVADTPATRDTGLMNRRSLDPDSGMIFVWDQDTIDGFWMENTYIPLTVAFLAADGTLLQMEDMAPLSTDVHYAHQPYRYAIEVNQGYFAKYHIQVGDRVQLRLH